jgi:hypothetical protein
MIVSNSDNKGIVGQFFFGHLLGEEMAEVEDLVLEGFDDYIALLNIIVFVGELSVLCGDDFVFGSNLKAE